MLVPTRPCSARFTRSFFAAPGKGTQRLVILGSGWGGYEVLRGIDKKNWDVTVISPNTYFNFTPLLAGAAVGTLEFRCTVEPVRRYTPQVQFYQAWADSIDFKQKSITCTPATPPVGFGESKVPSKSFNIPYDKLVIAVGAYRQTFNIPGVKEHAHFLKDVRDARLIRTRILECLEQANQPDMTEADRRKLLNFCIVGGGPTGVEFAAELHDLLHSEVAQHHPELARLTRISLYDVADSILGSFDSSLVRYTEHTLRKEGINIYTKHNVEKVEAGKLFIKDVGEVPFGLLVWSTGLAPNPLTSSIDDFKKRPRTDRLMTDEFLNVLRTDGTADQDVFAIGDAASVEVNPLPATAQVANQKAKYVVKSLNRLLQYTPSFDEKGNTKPLQDPFRFQNRGSLAYIGGWRAIYDRSKTSEGEPDQNPMSKESGKLAWLLWRSAYFTQTLSLRNKILVPFYWFLNWIFGRDLTRF
ncbi:FAD/NAD(P)-binding domain-containing protein [Cylindrobasidium torrendii FP15055 ss-10]|uniref:NADH:ubiquinone reductase (non-electrogenic) n=1 Tax=Cylindrobasidium torrendii FP15055 ss-10 TaxID=1314674 RepID=A0A0D7AV58_9AGAR|nr:FAD/NAD(P)-binding domain-containing protein [Cylindrobasidium torrendii FP15055 ss-10]